MCGLVGMAGDMTFKHRDVMKTLLFFNTLRGKDSTGVSAYDMKKHTLETRKMTCPGYDFVNMPWIDSLLCSVEGIWLGHGRHKTVGEVSRMNAHPFEVRSEDDKICLVGAHNGTLKTKYEIQKKLGEEFGTDSEALLNLIWRDGIKEALKEAQGAWALTWWDSKNNSINFCRNEERPLFYTYTKDRKVLIWSSEAWMIRVAAMRHGLELAQNPAGTQDAIYELTPDTHLCWELPGFSHPTPLDERKFGDPERKGGMVGKPEKRFQYTGNYGVLGYNPDDPNEHSAWYSQGGTSNRQPRSGSEQKGSEKAGQTGKTGGQKTPGPQQVVGFEGELVDRTFVAELLKQGCDWCGDAMGPDAKYAWLDDMSLCCAKCLRGEHFVVNVQEGTIVEKILTIVKGGKK